MSRFRHRKYRRHHLAGYQNRCRTRSTYSCRQRQRQHQFAPVCHRRQRYAEDPIHLHLRIGLGDQDGGSASSIRSRDTNSAAQSASGREGRRNADHAASPRWAAYKQRQKPTSPTVQPRAGRTAFSSTAAETEASPKSCQRVRIASCHAQEEPAVPELPPPSETR